MDLDTLNQKINTFADEREWRQFHNPKDLAAALSIEVAELQELMLWTPTDQSAARVTERFTEVEHEVGDILVYLLRFCQITGIDPVESAVKKMDLNAKKYPVEKSRGNSKKYTEL